MCQTRKHQLSFEDHSKEDNSDNESVASLDREFWAASGSEDSDQQEERDVPSPNAGREQVLNSIWGWGVHKRLLRPESMPLSLIKLTNFKLLLDTEDSTKALRDKSAQDLKKLRPAKVVDIISEYLIQLFKHTKARLAEHHGLREESCVEFVLCVPTSWTDKACRVMQDAMTTAVRISQLSRLQHVTDESFLLLDCGGGTVDAITYKLVRTRPPRMEEVVPPKGVSCGSSFLNARYRKLLQERLEHAQFVGTDLTLERMIESKVQLFETEKRSIDILDRKAMMEPVPFYGLQANPSLRIRNGNLDLSWKEMYDVFKSCLRGVTELMLSQLNDAKTKGVNVKTVILTGGFGNSPSLKNHLSKVLQKQKSLFYDTIDLKSSHFVDSAVARGAVLRALRKDYGPQRITRSSYGVLRSELYDEMNPRHRRLRVNRDRADGELYIMNTIDWILQKGTLLEPRYEMVIKSRHMFQIHEDFLCEEVLYVSSEIHQSGYKFKHKENKGAEEAGKILADLTFLKTKNQIQPTTVTNAKGKVYSYYEVEYDLWIIIEARTLRFEARSPLNKDKVSVSADFSIAAGFIPGTQ
ncbi:hypothetical protein OIDMADRAFT_131241 [Oidiodendron maius Zn]|uniref:Uncharacterized protein n=1 Tax=Oidiodendron maius (strain Zn) TaxID=913774 RepID=A0A0C3H0G8_OIDMZ|nr:hypothetical protein OIDMADRAFT_131241 [Oidiodendron maius Zn]